MQRNFYGVYRVRSVGVGDPPIPAYSLNHGTTSHGFQFRDPKKRMIPTAYYGKQSGIGLALTHYRDILANDPTQKGMKVGLIGLGTGTLAAYGQDGDRYRFYEINPDIIDLALGEGDFFTYLSDSSAVSEIIPGDARISLEIELESGHPQAFDILVVDAFNSDAIPIHLLTVEAFEIYQRHLKPEGVLALHISNRYLNLTPLVRSLADYHHLYTALIRNPRDDSAGSYPASWILLSKNLAFFQIPDILENTISPPENNPNIQAWTDDYSNLVPLIKLDVFFQD